MPQIKIINHSQHPLPRYATTGAAGMDVYARLVEPVILPPLGRSLIPTGLYIELPEGYEAQIRPRSGLAMKQGITVLNSPGTIDCDYRGEIKILLINLSDVPQQIGDGERIAQMVIARYEQCEWMEVEELSESDRGDRGFGHTGR